ncbi:hypothetical protein AB0C18_29105 [Nonomuraea muscovyensis]|uniref:hypothetical protein n=1 Tax=Nonomuraea muscovyensis TaxID=1124761 RepID=UPI00340A298F
MGTFSVPHSAAVSSGHGAQMIVCGEAAALAAPPGIRLMTRDETAASKMWFFIRSFVVSDETGADNPTRSCNHPHNHAITALTRQAAAGPPEVTALHLTRVRVTGAEQQAVAAEIALARAGGGVLPDRDQVGARWC